MNTEEPVSVLPPEKPVPRFSGKRLALALAFAIAALADGVSLFLTLTPPVQWAADVATAVVLFLVLGRQMDPAARPLSGF